MRDVCLCVVRVELGRQPFDGNEQRKKTYIKQERGVAKLHGSSSRLHSLLKNFITLSLWVILISIWAAIPTAVIAQSSSIVCRFGFNVLFICWSKCFHSTVFSNSFLEWLNGIFKMLQTQTLKLNQDLFMGSAPITFVSGIISILIRSIFMLFGKNPCFL